MQQNQAKVILVTGASTGLGRATADHLAALGHRVYGTSRRPQDAGRTDWPLLALDVCSDGQVAACVAQVLAREGRIDALVNNAGHALVAAVAETSQEALRHQMEVNFFGAQRLVQAVLPGMRARGHGRIINISSLSGVVPTPYLGAYGASKHALEAMSEALAHELRGSDVAVTLIEPDGMRTAIGFHQPAQDDPELGPRRRHVVGLLQHVTTAGGNDPALLAQAVAGAILAAQPPLRIVVGEAARELIAARRRLDDRTFGDMLAERLQLDAVPA